MRFSLKTVLAGAIGLLALAAVGQGLASAVALSEIEGNAVAISQQALPAQDQAEAIGTAVRDARLRLYRLAVHPRRRESRPEPEALTDTLGEFSGLRQGYQERLTSPRDRAVYERFTTAWNAYQNIQLQVVELMIAGDQPVALALVLDPATGAQNDAAVASLTEAIAAARAQTEANVAEAAAGGHARQAHRDGRHRGGLRGRRRRDAVRPVRDRAPDPAHDRRDGPAWPRATRPCRSRTRDAATRSARWRRRSRCSRTT